MLLLRFSHDFYFLTHYLQVFVRDFFPCGLACLMKNPPELEIVKNFLLKTLHLQGWEKRIDNFTLGEGVMPASFKVQFDLHRQKETLVADFGASAIGRVAPVDSGFWWIILLRSYTKCKRDYALAELPEVQRGMKLILNLCLSDGFDTFPTLLCADGCSMIDRRMVSFLLVVFHNLDDSISTYNSNVIMVSASPFSLSPYFIPL